jgi:hypothetical protein
MYCKVMRNSAVYTKQSVEQRLAIMLDLTFKIDIVGVLLPLTMEPR